MPPKKHDTLWDAAPHTIAKISILESYLQAWYPIFGRNRGRFDLLYIDGFAGPGRYLNHSDGSPIVALRAASIALGASGSAWKAGAVHCAFIELDRPRYEHLDAHVDPFRQIPRLSIHVLNTSFVDGLRELRETYPQAFTGRWPLFVFIDPFGATGAPFSAVTEILSSPRSEVLINFDADSIARIFLAGASADHDRILSEVYGDRSWQQTFTTTFSFEDRCRAALDLYKSRLRSLSNVRYIFFL